MCPIIGLAGTGKRTEAIALPKAGTVCRRNRGMFRRTACKFGLTITFVLASATAQAGLVEDLDSGYAHQGIPPDLGRVDAAFQEALSPQSSKSNAVVIAPTRVFNQLDLSNRFARFGEEASLVSLLSETSFGTHFESVSLSNPAGDLRGGELAASFDAVALDPGTAVHVYPVGNAASSLVPEPSVLVLLAAGIPALIGRRRWRRR